jgi:hypothetical protein
MLAQLAKSKGYMYSAWQGLFARTPENKKGELVADDWDDIARVLIGPDATGDNIDSVEAIMASLPEDQAQALLAHVKQDKNWAERTPKISEDIRRMRQLAGMKEADVVSPRFAGVQQTTHADGSATTDYQAGPLQTTNKVDAQGRPITSKSSYDLGVGTVDSELDHASGVRSNAITARGGMDPNKLIPTADIAAARGVDPKKFARFQKQNPSAVRESPELIAMLTIARLR